jgi:transcriptional regulator NrdR family protein
MFCKRGGTCHENSEVIDSRFTRLDGIPSTRRRRKCVKCGKLFTTREIPHTEYQKLKKVERLYSELRTALRNAEIYDGAETP